MPRKGPVPKREVLPDPLYSSRLVTKFVNRLMYNGKKGAAEKIFYSSLETLAEKTGEDPMRAFEKALDNVKPHMEVKARRVGGATYQVPIEVRPERRQTLALRWLVDFSRKRGEKTAYGCCSLTNWEAAERLCNLAKYGNGVRVDVKAYCEDGV